MRRDRNRAQAKIVGYFKPLKDRLELQRQNWKDRGKTLTPHPGMNRKDRRSYFVGSDKRRIEGPDTTTKFTKPPLGKRRRIRRQENQMARIARRANRGR